MTEDSIYYWFDPNSPGWIRRKLDEDEYVSQADIARVLRLHPECFADPLIQEHILLQLEGKIDKPKGRPADSFTRRAMICVAGMLAREQIEEWRAGPGNDRPKKGRGEKSYSEVAYEKFGLPLGLSGRGLANAVSSLKTNPLFGERPS